MKYQLIVVILTYNEQVHIARAIKNVINWADKIIVLDSHSQDKTVEIAKSYGVEVLYRKFDNYKNQRQYAIEFCKKITEWMLFLDADEYLLPALKVEISDVLSKESGVVGYYLPRRAIFLGKWIKHGGQYPSCLLRLFQPETATLSALVNEHVILSGHTQKLKNDFVDENLKGIAFWVEKHNKYTDLEAEVLWAARGNKVKTKGLRIVIQSDRKRWIRENIWNHLPVLWRSCLYFIYRYFFRMGFLDGRAGLIYHLLQGGWLFFIVDVKYLEMKIKDKKTICNSEISHEA